jgi:transcriptional regulator with XRE-family HTH domain
MKKQLGSAIREIREQRGLIQSELARSADLSTSQISNIERGEFAPSIEALEKIARTLKVRLPALFQFDLLPAIRRGSTRSSSCSPTAMR